MARKPPATFDPKAFLARVGNGGSVGTYAAGQAIFVQGDPADAVFYIQKGEAVLDNGVDTSNGARNPTDTGLGTGIVAALVRQLHGRIETGTGLNGLGTLVSITGRLPSPSN